MKTGYQKMLWGERYLTYKITCNCRCLGTVFLLFWRTLYSAKSSFLKHLNLVKLSKRMSSLEAEATRAGCGPQGKSACEGPLATPGRKEAGGGFGGDKGEGLVSGWRHQFSGEGAEQLDVKLVAVQPRAVTPIRPPSRDGSDWRHIGK